MAFTRMNISVLGEASVGKTCLIIRFYQDVFIDYQDYEESWRKTTTIEDVSYVLDIWEYQSSEFPALEEAPLRFGQAFLLCFNVASRASFEELTLRKDKLHEFRETHLLPMVLVGTKADLEEREVLREEAKHRAAVWEVPYIETSAKTGAGIDEAFMEIVREAQKERFRKTTKKKKTQCITM